MLLRLTPGLVVLWSLGALAGAPARPPIPDVLAELRKIESASLRGKGDETRIKYENVSKQTPNDVMLKVYAAWTVMPADDAWNQLKALTSLDPDNPWIHLGMARVYTRWKGMGDQAKHELSGVLAKDSGFYPALTGLGELALGKGDAAEAEKQFGLALQKHEDPRARAGLGQALLAQGKKPEAKAALEQAVNGWADQPHALQALLAIYSETKDNAKASQTAQRLVELWPRNREVRRAAADLSFDQGDFAKAASGYEELLRLGNPEVVVLERLERIYRESKDVAAEERTLKAHAVLDKENVAPISRLAELAQAQGKADVAEERLKEATERAPKSAAVWLAYGRALKAKSPHFAVDAFRKGAAGEGPEAAAALEEKNAIEATFELPKRPLKGSVDNINWAVSRSIDTLFTDHQKVKWTLGGSLKLRVRVSKEGEVLGVDVLEDTVEDPIVTGHAYFALKDAVYPKQKREPVFEFALKGKKAK